MCYDIVFRVLFVIPVIKAGSKNYLEMEQIASEFWFPCPMLWRRFITWVYMYFVLVSNYAANIFSFILKYNIYWCLFIVENLETYEVEEFLADVLNREFDTVADDGSLAQVLFVDLHYNIHWHITSWLP